MRPVTVYLDSRDYSMLSDAERRTPALERAFDALSPLINEGKVALVWSMAHVLEMFPTDESVIAAARSRLWVMMRLSSGRSFLDVGNVAKIEAQFHASPMNLDYALGQWAEISRLPGYNSNPVAYLDFAASQGRVAEFRALLDSQAKVLMDAIGHVRGLVRTDPRYSNPEKETAQAYAAMLITLFTGAPGLRLSDQALGCHCAGKVMRQLVLDSVRTSRTFRPSDAADMWHAYYAPYVDVWSGDRYFANIVGQACPATTMAIGSPEDVIATIVSAVNQRFRERQNRPADMG